MTSCTYITYLFFRPYSMCLHPFSLYIHSELVLVRFLPSLDRSDTSDFDAFETKILFGCPGIDLDAAAFDFPRRIEFSTFSL